MGLKYTMFINEFSAALTTVGGRLSSDIGGCPGSYMGMSCAEYKSTNIDHVMSMSTYTHDPASFRKQIKTNSAMLGLEKYAVGIDTGFPADKLQSSLEASFSAGGMVAIWANAPSPEFMAAIGGWLRG